MAGCACTSTVTALKAARPSEYRRLDRWLHWLALAPESSRRLAFDLERQFALPDRSTVVDGAAGCGEDDPAARAVYVCGLARSGTTILLRVLGELDAFRSLTYRDMPFVLAPNIWAALTRSGQQDALPSERAHGDGMLVDFDSPEAFEEVFWRTFGEALPDDSCDGMVPPTDDVMSAFADYRALVANPRARGTGGGTTRKRYLSKNNNNLMRLGALSRDTTATILLAYRDPVATAQSLHRQHLNFCSVHARDGFGRRYMRWLGHREFGLDHRPFCFARPGMDPALSPDDVNYWLDYWNAVYRHILQQQDARFILVNHEILRRHPVGMLTNLLRTLGIDANIPPLAELISPEPQSAPPGVAIDEELLRRATETHRLLCASERNLRP